jgi:hypothetical protein
MAGPPGEGQDQKQAGGALGAMPRLIRETVGLGASAGRPYVKLPGRYWVLVGEGC